MRSYSGGFRKPMPLRLFPEGLRKPSDLRIYTPRYESCIGTVYVHSLEKGLLNQAHRHDNISAARGLLRLDCYVLTVIESLWEYFHT